MAEIKLKNLTKRWGNFVGVDSFNLDIQDKEFLVLLGPSGCGKTTTMRMIAGLEEVSEGEIWIENELVNLEDPKDRDVAMVFQSYALYPNMTVYENIKFPLKVRKIEKVNIMRWCCARQKRLNYQTCLNANPLNYLVGNDNGLLWLEQLSESLEFF